MSERITTNTDSKRKRQTQCLADSFWKRWMKDYLPALQTRQKWVSLVKTSLLVAWFLFPTRRLREAAGQWARLWRFFQTGQKVMIMYAASRCKRPHLFTHMTLGSCASLKDSRNNMNSINVTSSKAKTAILRIS